MEKSIDERSCLFDDCIRIVRAEPKRALSSNDVWGRWSNRGGMRNGTATPLGFSGKPAMAVRRWHVERDGSLTGEWEVEREWIESG